MVARVAAERAGEEDLRRLEEIAGRAAQAESPDDLLKHDFEFYVALTQAGKNRVLQLLINTIRGTVVTYADAFAAVTQAPETVRQHHRQLLEAIRGRSSGDAMRIADDYLANGAARLMGDS
jgi:DNA-binding FadR family transcriptional regulator